MRILSVSGIAFFLIFIILLVKFITALNIQDDIRSLLVFTIPMLIGIIFVKSVYS